MRTQQVQCIIFRRVANGIEYLLLKRIPKKGGFWQPPCGGVEKEDKSILDSAYREIWEETSITRENILRVIRGVHKFTINKDYLTGESTAPITEYVFGFEVKPDVKINFNSNFCDEHEEFRWMSLESAQRMLKWKDNKIAFQKLHRKLEKE